jgi:sRNA-binding protein
VVDARFVMDHRPRGAIGMTAGEDVLKTEAATAAPVTVARRIGAFPNGGQVMPMERTVGLLLTAALPIEDPRIESLRIDILRTDNRLIVGPPLIVALPRAVLQATVLPIVVQEIRVRATAGLPLIVAPQSTGLQIAR